MPIIRIPSDASPEIKETFRQIQTILSRLAGDRNIDHHGRRIINAGDAISPQDYVTLAQIRRIIDESIVASEEQEESEESATSGGPVLTEGSVLFVGPGGRISQNNSLFRWDNVSLQLTIDAEILEAVWSGEVIDIGFGGTGASTAAQARINLGIQVYKDNQFPVVNMGAGNTVENQALPATVADVRKAFFIPITGLVRVITAGDTVPITAHFANSGGADVTSGPATHIRLEGGDANSPATTYRFIVVEWE